MNGPAPACGITQGMKSYCDPQALARAAGEEFEKRKKAEILRVASFKKRNRMDCKTSWIGSLSARCLCQIFRKSPDLQALVRTRHEWPSSGLRDHEGMKSYCDPQALARAAGEEFEKRKKAEVLRFASYIWKEIEWIVLLSWFLSPRFLRQNFRKVIKRLPSKHWRGHGMNGPAPACGITKEWSRIVTHKHWREPPEKNLKKRNRMDCKTHWVDSFLQGFCVKVSEK